MVMIKIIPLTQGQKAVVNDFMFDYLIKDKWYAKKSSDGKKYYAARTDYSTGKPVTIRMHRAIAEYILEMNGEYELLEQVRNHPRKHPIDHKNRNGLINTWENLRIVNSRQNNQNRDLTNKTSRFPGVSYHESNKSWRARIWRNGKQETLGYIKPRIVNGIDAGELEAAQLYEKACREEGEELVCKVLRMGNPLMPKLAVAK
jgi:ribosomal protein S15P/S13E